MRLHSHIQKTLDLLAGASQTVQASFAFLCAERLRGCCAVYQAVAGINFERFFQKLDALFDILRGQSLVDLDLKQTVFELENIVPNSGECLSTQAQSGVICLLTGYAILAGEARISLKDAVMGPFDALDNYEFFVKRRIQGDLRGPEDGPLFFREANRQLDDAEFIRNHNRANAQVFFERRIENLQFAIPPAI